MLFLSLIIFKIGVFIDIYDIIFPTTSSSPRYIHYPSYTRNTSHNNRARFRGSLFKKFCTPPAVHTRISYSPYTHANKRIIKRRNSLLFSSLSVYLSGHHQRNDYTCAIIFAQSRRVEFIDLPGSDDSRES